MELIDILDINHWARHSRAGVHFFAAVTALLLGPVILGQQKGTQNHRWLGRFWVLLMLTLNLSALTMYGADGRPNIFHALALLNLWALVPGVLAIRRFATTKNQTDLIEHRLCMHWAYFGLVAAGVWQVASRVCVIGLSIDFNSVLLVLGALTAIASWRFNGWLNRQMAAAYSNPSTTPR